MLDLKNAKLIQDADLLILTVFTGFKEKGFETKHSTAKCSNADKALRLLFTHISSRYSDASVLEKEANI